MSFVVPTPVRRIARFAALALALSLNASVVSAATPPSAFDEVTVEPTRTSIYVGSVRLEMPPFKRADGSYHSTYKARVRPYFFASESGTIRIQFDDHHQQRLAAGETITFEGEAVNEDGSRRQITGHAVPADALSGTIKVRVHVSPRIELIFNTTYRFTGPAAPAENPNVTH